MQTINIRHAHYLEEGVSAAKRGDLEVAGVAFQRALELAPQDARTLFWRGLTADHAGEASRFLARALRRTAPSLTARRDLIRRELERVHRGRARPVSRWRAYRLDGAWNRGARPASLWVEGVRTLAVAGLLAFLVWRAGVGTASGAMGVARGLPERLQRTAEVLGISRSPTPPPPEPVSWQGELEGSQAVAAGEGKPTPTPEPSPTPEPRTYVVQRGDYLSKIARRFGVSVQDLIEANQLENPSLLRPGQELIIPVASSGDR